MATKRKGGDISAELIPPKTSKKDVLSDAKVLEKESFLPYLDLEKKKCRECEKEFDVTKSYNIKRHFENRHKDVVAKLVAEFEEKRAAESKITKHIQRIHSAYGELVNLFASAPLSMNLIENEHLQKILSYIPNFKPPKLRKLYSLMHKRLAELMKYVKDNCVGNYYAVGCDCGTTKGMLHSYLAVSIHFIDKKSKSLTAASFELKELEGAHTASFLRSTLEDALKKEGLSVEHISKIVTDGAKNMANAFFEPFKVSTDDNGKEIIEEINDDAHSKLLDEYEKFLLSDQDVEEFQFLMDDYESIASPNNLHCVAHRIQLLFKDVFEKGELLAVRKSVFETINHFARSQKASSELYERSKLRLLFPAATRWSTLTITYERVLKLKDHINIIALKNGWQTLSKQTTDAIHNIVLLSKDLTDCTTTIQSDSRPTISLLYPGFHNIKTNLQLKKSQVKCHPNIDFENVTDDLLAGIDKRFNDILSTNDESGDPLFAAATLMDSTTAGLFPNLEDLTLEETKKTFYAISKKLKMKTNETDDPVVPPSQPVKKNPLGFVIQPPLSQLASMQKTFGKEITEFYTLVKEGNWNFENPIAAWFMHKKQFPKLSEIAMAILVIPATSAAVERMFSQLKIHSDGHKTRSKTHLSRLRVLLSSNKKLYHRLVVEKIL